MQTTKINTILCFGKDFEWRLSILVEYMIVSFFLYGPTLLLGKSLTQGGKLVWEADSIPPPQVLESVREAFGKRLENRVEATGKAEWKWFLEVSEIVWRSNWESKSGIVFIDSIVYIILFQSNINDSNSMVFIQGLL